MSPVKQQLSRWRQAAWLFFLIMGLFGLQLGELDGLFRDSLAIIGQPAISGVQQVQEINNRLLRMSLLLTQGSERLASAEHEIALCQVESDRLTLLEKENTLLREALGQQPRDNQPQTLQFYGSGENWFVNGGRNVQIETGNLVMWEGSLVGRVTDVYDYHSRVQTLLDQDWQIPVEVGTASAKALLTQVRGFSEVQLIPKNAPVENDSLVSSAGDEYLPPNLPIGRLANLQDQPDGATKQAELQLFVHPKDIRLVEIIKR
jgi:cell shape-determining protein MreC